MLHSALLRPLFTSTPGDSIWPFPRQLGLTASMLGLSPSLRDRTFQAPTQRETRGDHRLVDDASAPPRHTLQCVLWSEVFCGGWSANPATNILGKVTNCSRMSTDTVRTRYGWSLADKELRHPLICFVFNPAGCPCPHTLHTRGTWWGSQFSRRHLTMNRLVRVLHDTRSKSQI